MSMEGFIVDSGASLHMAIWHKPSAAEKATLRIMAEGEINITTADHDMPVSEEGQLWVQGLQIYVWVAIIHSDFDTPHLLSLGSRCMDEGIEFRWKPYSHPYLSC